jgi:hypothetical protein
MTMSTNPVPITSDFENILNTMNTNCQLKGTPQNRHYPTKTPMNNSTPTEKNMVFDSLIEQNSILDEAMEQLIVDITNIKENRADSFQKNLTFTMIFSALNVAVKEYTYQSTLFSEYANQYGQMCNEENSVKILDILRMIIADRRMVLNEVMSNILKIQRLDNDRIKLDNAIGDDSDLGDLLSPESL